MIFWTKQKPETKIVDILKLKVENSISIGEAANALLSSGKLEFRESAGTGVRKLLNFIDKKRKIDSFTAKDAVGIFETFLKKENEAAGFQVRAALVNSIRFAVTGNLPAPVNTHPQQSSNGNGDVGRMKFSVGEFKDMAHLIPLYSTAGRFGWIKAEVQRHIFQIKSTQSVMIEPQKRLIDEKEGRGIEREITKMFAKGNLPWVIRYNPNDKVFVIASKSNFETLTKNQKGAIK